MVWVVFWVLKYFGVNFMNRYIPNSVNYVNIIFNLETQSWIELEQKYHLIKLKNNCNNNIDANQHHGKLSIILY